MTESILQRRLRERAARERASNDTPAAKLSDAAREQRAAKYDSEPVPVIDNEEDGI